MPEALHDLAAAAEDGADRSSENILLAEFDDGGACRACDLNHLQPGRDHGAAGQAKDILFAAPYLRAQVGAAGADNLGAAAVDCGETSDPTREDIEGAAADDGAGRRPAGLNDLRARNDRGPAGEAEIKLRAAADLRASVGPARGDGFDSAGLDLGGAGHSAGFENKSDAVADDCSTDRAKHVERGAAVQCGSARIAASVDN